MIPQTVTLTSRQAALATLAFAVLLSAVVGVGYRIAVGGVVEACGYALGYVRATSIGRAADYAELGDGAYVVRLVVLHETEGPLAIVDAVSPSTQIPLLVRNLPAEYFREGAPFQVQLTQVSLKAKRDERRRQ